MDIIDTKGADAHGEAKFDHIVDGNPLLQWYRLGILRHSDNVCGHSCPNNVANTCDGSWVFLFCFSRSYGVLQKKEQTSHKQRFYYYYYYRIVVGVIRCFFARTY